MTDKEKAVVMAYTGVTMLTGEKFSIFHKYIEDIMGRPVWTHELADRKVWEQIKGKSKTDFLKLCQEEVGYEPYEEKQKGKWIEETDEHLKGMYRCSVCGRRVEDLTDDVKIHIGWEDCTVADIYPFCHCGADMRKEEV